MHALEAKSCERKTRNIFILVKIPPFERNTEQTYNQLLEINQSKMSKFDFVL